MNAISKHIPASRFALSPDLDALCPDVGTMKDKDLLALHDAIGTIAGVTIGLANAPRFDTGKGGALHDPTAACDVLHALDDYMAELQEAIELELERRPLTTQTCGVLLYRLATLTLTHKPGDLMRSTQELLSKLPDDDQ